MKRLLLFTEDRELIRIAGGEVGEFQSYPYDIDINNVAVNGDDIVLLDYDYEGTDMRRFLLSLVSQLPADVKVLVLSRNCDRREVSYVAKSGADRFLVKPLGKKRFRSLVLPYFEGAEYRSEAVQ